MLTYGGIRLPTPQQAVADQLERHLSRQALFEFFRPTAPVPERHRPFRLNTLWWPTGASRWAEGHFLVHTSALAQIRQLAYSTASANRYQALPLVMTHVGYDGIGFSTAYTVSTDLFMLPARPIADIANLPDSLSGLWLLTLVDQRYFFWEKSAAITVTGGTTTWANLFTSIGSALGVTIATDTISADYLKPAADLSSQYEYLPPLLDAACRSVGHRLVCNLDGTIETQSAATAKADQDTQWGTWVRRSGGRFAFHETSAPQDVGGLVPATVRVVFPRTDNGTPATTVHTDTATLTGLALSQYPAEAVGHDGVKVLVSTATATYAGGGSPTNDTELSTLTDRMATDWYLWQLARNDVEYAGIVPYAPEGMSDFVEWTYRADQAGCRIVRGPWNGLNELYFHHGTGGSLTECCPGVFWDGSTVIIPTITTGGSTTITYPAQITSDQDDYDPGSGDVFFIDQNASYFIGGIDTTNTSDLIYIYNDSDFVLTIPHEKATSTAEYRIKTPTGTDMHLPPDRGVILIYDDTTDDRWKVVADDKDVFYSPKEITHSSSSQIDTEESTQAIVDVTSDDIAIRGILGWRALDNPGSILEVLIDPASTYGVEVVDSYSNVVDDIITPTGEDYHFRPGGSFRVQSDGVDWQMIAATGYGQTSLAYSPGSSVNNYSVGLTDSIIVTGASGGTTMTGMVVTGGNVTGTRKTISVTGEHLRIPDNSSSSSTNNRFRHTTGTTFVPAADLIVPRSGCITVEALASSGTKASLGWQIVSSSNREWHAPVEIIDWTVVASYFYGGQHFDATHLQTYARPVGYIDADLPYNNQLLGTAGGIDGGMLTFVNFNSTTVTLGHDYGSVANADEKIKVPTAVDLPIPQYYSVEYRYFDVLGQWLVTGGTALAKYAIDQIPTTADIQDAVWDNVPVFTFTGSATGDPVALTTVVDTETLLSSNEVVFTADEAGDWQVDYNLNVFDIFGTFAKITGNIRYWNGSTYTTIASVNLPAYTSGGASEAAGSCSTIIRVSSGNKLKITASVTSPSGTPTVTARFSGHLIRKT